MAEPMELSPTQDVSLKRPSPSDQDPEKDTCLSKKEFPTPPSTASPHRDANREASPAPSTSSLTSLATTAQHDAGPPGTSTEPPKKRRKLTPAEKELQRVEKEQKAAEKEKQRAQKEAEKLVKDEEKRRKKEEKEVKDREKELEKQRKEHEKQKKEDERLKKERAQPKLAAFFVKPKTPLKHPQPPADLNSPLGQGRRKSMSVEPGGEPVLLAQHTPMSCSKPRQTDYERKFLPFQLPSFTTMAPFLHLHETGGKLLEHLGNERSTTDTPSPVSSFFRDLNASSRGIWQPNAREVMETLNGSSHKPIDLTDDSGVTYRAEDLLQHVTIRHLQFAEDVRPPYSGSYTKILSPRSTARVRRNPFTRVRKDTDYDYDSEAEWEEPEEGEDLLSDGEDDEESIGAADEMEDFLDEDEGGPKRRLITGDLKPVSTGLCWESGSLPVKAENLDMSSESADLESMKLAFYLDLPTKSIDPFSTSYWVNEAAKAPVPTVQAIENKENVIKLENGKLSSPRPPLQARLNTSGARVVDAASGAKGPIMIDKSVKVAKPTAKPLEGQELSEFCTAVVGSNAPKGDLLKLLKKEFPKITNDTLKSTLTALFEFSGTKRAEKTWVFIG